MIVRTYLSRLAVVAGLLCLGTSRSSAQAVGGGKISPTQAPNSRRLDLEQRLRERTGEVVKRRLALSDDQMSRLQTTNRQFEQQRGDLVLRERETRQALRAQLLSGDSANQSKVSQLLDQSLLLQRQRLDLLQSEQRELSKFLSPVQRARYFGLQNEMRKRAQEVRSGQVQRPGMNGMRRQLRRGARQ